MKKLYLKLFSFLFLAGIFPFHSLCQDYVNWNVAEKYTADSLSGHYRSSLLATWIPDTHHFYYAIEKKARGDSIWSMQQKEKRNCFLITNV